MQNKKLLFYKLTGENIMSDSNNEKEVLVVTSKLKKYIQSSAGMSTSANVAPALSDIIRSLCDQAIENAKADKRKTVMDRDFS
jgi:histone H3/H4